MLNAIILFFCAFLIAVLGIRHSIERLRRLQPPQLGVVMKKAPHPVVDNAGIAVMFALIIGFLGADSDYVIIFSLFLAGGIGLLGSQVKLHRSIYLAFVTVAVALPLLIINPSLLGGLVPTRTDLVITAILWIGYTQLFQDCDKAEGVVATHSSAVGLGSALMLAMAGEFPETEVTLALIVAGCGFALSWWNWPPAKMRMGRVGNYPLGLACGYVLLLLVKDGYGLSVAIMVAFMAAEGLVMIISNRTTPLCQHAGAQGMDKDHIVRLITGIHMLLVLLAVFSALDPTTAVFNMAVAYGMALVVLWYFARYTPKQ
jgi:UDP-N-acetylmuramyl pentapeptide phosphotransferase/UDP-N-acetylglucosamine-1-phosphate transferase